jgi:hypothetical protein
MILWHLGNFLHFHFQKPNSIVWWIFWIAFDVIPTSELRVLGVDIGELHSGDRQKTMNAGIRPQREHRTRAEAREKQTRQHKKHHYSVPILGNS